MGETPEAAVPATAELADTLSLVNKRDRRIVRVVGMLAAVAVGSLTTWATLNARGEAFVDKRVEEKTAPRLDKLEKSDADHEARLRTEEQNAAEMKADLRTLKEDVHFLRERAEARVEAQ